MPRSYPAPYVRPVVSAMLAAVMSASFIAPAVSHEPAANAPEGMLEAPSDLDVARAGNSVTLTWTRPADVSPLLEYLVYDGDMLEAIVMDQGEQIEYSIPRVASGTHEFVVQARFRQYLTDGREVSPPSDTAAVTVPPSDDTDPPTTPTELKAFHDCDTNDDWYEFTPSTDGVSAPSDITYEWLERDHRTREWYVWHGAYDVPTAGNPWSIGAVRAVDEAGNRSEISERLYGIYLVNC